MRRTSKKTSKRDKKSDYDKIKKNKRVIEYSTDEIKTLRTPVGKAIYMKNDSDSSDDLDQLLTTSSESDPDTSYSFEKDLEESESSEESSSKNERDVEMYDESSSENEEDQRDQEYTFQTDEDIQKGGKQKEEESTEESEEVVNNPEPVIKKKAHYTDKLECKICGGKYTRSNAFNHKRTKKHQIYQSANDKFLALMLNK